MMAMTLDETGPTDAELAGRARDGDKDAFERLVERHYDFIHRVAYRWCGRKADAEDVAQDVCVRLGGAIRTYRQAGAFSTWLYALTLNACRDLGRRAARDDRRLQAYGEHLSVVGDGSGEEEAQAEALWAAVRRLTDKQRDAVLLVYGEGLSHAAAADVMAISETTVSWHIHEAKKRLKVLMRPPGEG
jgi:RNA polymerase sigma-70 factor (ECF subfamily)